MASTEGVSAITGLAPVEQNVSIEHAWTDFVVGYKHTYSGSLDAILSKWLDGCGNVQLSHIELTCQATEEKDELYVGFSQAGSVLTAKQVAMKKSGWSYKANAKNVGERQERKLIPEDNMSRQIRPNSSDLPMIQFHLSASKTMIVAVHFYYRVNGVRAHYDMEESK